MSAPIPVITALKMPVGTKIKIAAIVGAVGAALLSGIFFYLRKRTKEITAQRSADGNATPPFLKRAPSPVANFNKPIFGPSSRRRRGSISVSSSASASTLKENSDNAYSLIHFGVDSLAESIRSLERAVNSPELKTTKHCELSEGLEKALNIAYKLQGEINRLIEQSCPEILEHATTISAVGSNTHFGASDLPIRRTWSVLSDDSFVSALDDVVMSFPEVEAPVCDTQASTYDQLEFYKIGRRHAQAGQVAARCLRTDLLRCPSDEDFLAKLYCVRRAFQEILSDANKRLWLSDNGRDLIGAVIRSGGKDASGFNTAYDDMLKFADETEDWTAVLDELRPRNVVEISFYDVVLDFILMDSFDDLARPPASVLAVAQDRFLPASFKETTLSAVVWSVLRAKRAQLHVKNGFIAHFYEICRHASPVMAWGFLGTNEALREVCYYFKDQVCNFLIDIFSTDRVRYTSLEDLADDVWQVCQRRAMITRQRLMPSETNLLNGNEELRGIS